MLRPLKGHLKASKITNKSAVSLDNKKNNNLYVFVSYIYTNLYLLITARLISNFLRPCES